MKQEFNSHSSTRKTHKPSNEIQETLMLPTFGRLYVY